MSDQDTTGLSPALRAGLSVEIQPTRALPLTVFADFAFTSYRTDYLVEGFTETGTLNAVATNEQRYDMGAGAAYTLSLANGRVDLVPGLAVRVSMLQNELNPWDLGGIAPEGLVRVHLNRVVAVDVHGGYTYNLFFTHPAEQAVMGRPVALSTYGADVSFRLGGIGSDVVLGWTGEVLTRQHSYRMYDLFGLGFRYEIL